MKYHLLISIKDFNVLNMPFGSFNTLQEAEKAKEIYDKINRNGYYIYKIANTDELLKLRDDNKINLPKDYKIAWDLV